MFNLATLLPSGFGTAHVWRRKAGKQQKWYESWGSVQWRGYEESAKTEKMERSTIRANQKGDVYHGQS